MKANQKHPELKDGELFLSNTNGDAKNIPYKSKRFGSVAYDIDGNIIPGSRPIFVLEDEYKEHVKQSRNHFMASGQ